MFDADVLRCWFLDMFWLYTQFILPDLKTKHHDDPKIEQYFSECLYTCLLGYGENAVVERHPIFVLTPRASTASTYRPLPQCLAQDRGAVGGHMEKA